MKYKPKEPFNTPLNVEITFIFGTKTKKNQGQYKITRPDLDNSLKLVFDCMTDCEYWNDDSQIVKLIASKKWSDKSCIEIKISQL